MLPPGEFGEGSPPGQRQEEDGSQEESPENHAEGGKGFQGHFGGHEGKSPKQNRADEGEMDREGIVAPQSVPPVGMGRRGTGHRSLRRASGFGGGSYHPGNGGASHWR